MTQWAVSLYPSATAIAQQLTQRPSQRNSIRAKSQRSGSWSYARLALLHLHAAFEYGVTERIARTRQTTIRVARLIVAVPATSSSPRTVRIALASRMEPIVVGVRAIVCLFAGSIVQTMSALCTELLLSGALGKSAVLFATLPSTFMLVGAIGKSCAENPGPIVAREETIVHCVAESIGLTSIRVLVAIVLDRTGLTETGIVTALPATLAATAIRKPNAIRVEPQIPWIVTILSNVAFAIGQALFTGLSTIELSQTLCITIAESRSALPSTMSLSGTIGIAQTTRMRPSIVRVVAIIVGLASGIQQTSVGLFVTKVIVRTIRSGARSRLVATFPSTVAIQRAVSKPYTVRTNPNIVGIVAVMHIHTRTKWLAQRGNVTAELLFATVRLAVASLQHHNNCAFSRSLHWTGGKVGAMPATFLIHTSGSSHTERSDPVVV